MEACRCLKHVEANVKKGSFLENLVYNVMVEICLDMRNHDEESAKWAKLAEESICGECG